MHFVIVACHHGFCYAAQTAEAPASTYPKTGVAFSKRIHPSDKQSHFCIQQDPCQAPLWRLSVHPTALSLGSPDNSHNGGVMVLQKMLESPQWQTSTLPSLRRSLEQDARPEFCATRAGVFSTAEEPWAISACEKRARFWMELGWSGRLSSKRTRWIYENDKTRTWKTQAEEQEQRTTICSFDHATALEARRHTVERSGLDLFCDSHSSGGNGQRDQRSLHGREGHAGQHPTCGGEARPQQRPSTHCINEQNHQRLGEGTRQPAEALRSENKTSHTMDEPHEEPHGNAFQAGRRLRDPAEVLRRQAQIHPERHPGDQKRTPEAYSTSCSRPLCRSHGANHRGGRADGACRRCGRGCATQPSPRPAGKVPESGRQVQSGGDRLRRGEHGHQHRKRQQATQIGGAIRILCQVMLGNDGVCLRATMAFVFGKTIVSQFHTLPRTPASQLRPMTVIGTVVQQAGIAATYLGVFTLEPTTTIFVCIPLWQSTMPTSWLSNVALGNPIAPQIMMIFPRSPVLGPCRL